MGFVGGFENVVIRMDFVSSFESLKESLRQFWLYEVRKESFKKWLGYPSILNFFKKLKVPKMFVSKMAF